MFGAKTTACNSHQNLGKEMNSSYTHIKAFFLKTLLIEENLDIGALLFKGHFKPQKKKKKQPQKILKIWRFKGFYKDLWRL